MSARILVVSGSGAYADPWHPFPETSAAVAEILRPLGDVTVRDDVEKAVITLVDRASRPDLLVMNIGNAGPGTPGPEARDALLAAVADGLPLLALHSSATAFPDWHKWHRILGGHWVRGVTFHPPSSRCTIDLTPSGREIAGAVDTFETVDERYTRLHIEPGSTVWATQANDGVDHPLAWHCTGGDRRTAYIGLGHDRRSYASEGARALVLGAARWMLSY